MSLHRFVYYSAVVGGWMALLAWLVTEAWAASLSASLAGQLGPGEALRSTLLVAVAGAVVGGAISAGLTALAGAASGQWRQVGRRVPAGLIGGAAGGAVGGALGQFAFAALGLPRAVGWMVMGLAIGGVDGLYERSGKKLRNGLIGGALGGLLGGWLFDRIAVPEADMAARATALVILGVSIGAMIGLAQVVLKEAWLTVLDGFRPGRELILGQTVTVLGRGDHLALPLLGYAGRDLESEHARITRNRDGTFLLEDIHSRIGTLLNGQAVRGPTLLRDGDLIRLGGNIVRFNQRHGRRELAESAAGGPVDAGIAVISRAPPPAIGSTKTLPPLPRPTSPWASPPPNPRIPPPPTTPRADR